MRKINNKKLKLLLEEKNISQAKLAKELNVSPPTVSGWLNGKCVPDIENIDKICNYLKISTEELVNDYYNNFENNNDNNHIVNIYNYAPITVNSDSKNIDYEMLHNNNIPDNLVKVSISLEPQLVSQLMDLSFKENTNTGILIRDIISNFLKDKKNHKN